DERDFNFINISSKQGLSSNIVNAVIKDRYGFLWFATDDGLNKYDGKNFTVYRQNTIGLVSNEILDLYEDSRGDLWIGTGEGIVQYHRKSDSFTNYPDAKNRAVLSISEDLEGNIWLGGYHGLEILNIKTRRFAEPKLSNSRYQSVFQSTITRLLKDGRGDLWIGTPNGLFRYKRATKSLSIFKSNSSGLVDNTVNAICEDKRGNIWIGTSKGLSMLDLSDYSYVNYQFEASNRFSLSSNMVYSLAVDPHGEVWVGTEEGLNIVNPDKREVLRISKNGRNHFSLIGKAVKSIMIDEQGVYWVATFRGGVNKYDKNLAFFNLRQSNPYDPQGLNVPVITSFVQADKRYIYV
ncbi:hypothetical protein EIM50_25870, partial [Pseudoxanthomonas sp. SGD-10]